MTPWRSVNLAGDEGPVEVSPRPAGAIMALGLLVYIDTVGGFDFEYGQGFYLRLVLHRKKSVNQFLLND
jgi:hypothetical protein